MVDKSTKKKWKKMPDVVTHSHFIESVYHVVFFGNIMRKINVHRMSISEKVTFEEGQTIRFLTQSKVLIDTVSLIDELNNYLFRHHSTEESVNSKISSYKQIIQPVLDQINLWEDLRKVRNNVLAHNYRIDGKNNFESVHLSNKLHVYNFPSSLIDLGIIFKLVDVIATVAEEIFEDEYKEALLIINSFENVKNKKLQRLEDEIKNINSVLQEVNERIQKFNAK
ncbi:MAG: hypothetical protein K2Q24_11530 [Chitinophagaceae bacterium]|nr:hypothetical protein [Chitinophagaceae bacterium]